MAGKRYKKSLEKIEEDKIHDIDKGLQLALDTATASFDETIDLAVKLGVDAKQTDQQVRGALSLPHGLGKTVAVFGFCQR